MESTLEVQEGSGAEVAMGTLLSNGEHHCWKEEFSYSILIIHKWLPKDGCNIKMKSQFDFFSFHQTIFS